MELALSILLDEMETFAPVLVKAHLTKTKFEQVRFFRKALAESDDRSLYIVQESVLLSSCTGFPKNLIVVGGGILTLKLEEVDVLVQITEDFTCETVMQKLFEVYNDYNQWDQRLLIAILENKGIEDFLKIAAEKLSNPIALFDNSLTAIATAGSFFNSTAGTIWEKIDIPGYPLADFFTLKEQQELTLKMLKQVEDPYLYQPILDQGHTYASAHIWVDEKLCGNLGLVDINEPFSQGQLQIIWHITERLTRYYKNDDTYIHIAENQTHFIKALIENPQTDEKNISYHLKRFGLKRDDDYYMVCFSGPMTQSSEIERMSFIKRINHYYNGAIVSVYDERILLILPAQSFPLKNASELNRLKELLNKYELSCGISNGFDDFMKLRYYYFQSLFAAQMSEREDSNYCFYEFCYPKHLMTLLDSVVDLHVICHPEILEMKESGEEHKIELIHCLLVFLQHGGNLSSASKALNLHRNTLIYRIEKMGKILKTDLNNLSEENIFFLLFSCMLAETISQQV
ncbi:MAG: hypothetical protein PWP16_643 [Eubacteriaceae bacterium]|jgi:hypothetical protein|nr:hypothetical protein [Eubacteriaceae bacterium]MDK2904422.1 hypothetical protein [Eubacteriaceae bacterium]MDN5307280.1 hypothetical protein [Eubacteriaceae bacterium]